LEPAGTRLLVRAVISTVAICPPLFFPESAAAAVDKALGGPQYKIESKPSRRIEAVATVSVHCPRFRADKWNVLVAVAPELPSQRDVSTALAPGGESKTETSAYKRPILWSDHKVSSREERTLFQYTVTYRATLQKRKLVPLLPGEQPPEVEPLTADEKRLHLPPTEYYDFNNREFQRWLKKHGLDARVNESEVDFARRVLLVIYDTLKYQGAEVSNQASVICREGKSHCGGLSSVFVSAMRANGIPARWLLGSWANSTTPPETPYHVLAEFYAEGIGWVPVDPAVAVYYHRDDREVMLEKCFGADSGNFLTTQVDHGFEFDPGTADKWTMPWPFSATPTGRGSLAKWETVYDWKVVDLAAAE
jgi:transglutaminase-like putative cysteine protease